MEKHDFDLITSTCTMSYCRIVLVPPLLTNLEASREGYLRGLGSFIEANTGTRKCVLGKRA
jgi:hypothetical protein